MTFEPTDLLRILGGIVTGFALLAFAWKLSAGVLRERSFEIESPFPYFRKFLVSGTEAKTAEDAMRHHLIPRLGENGMISVVVESFDDGPDWLVTVHYLNLGGEPRECEGLKLGGE